MVFDGIILSVIIGFFRKGNLNGLASMKLKWGWVFPVLLIFQFIIFTQQNKFDKLADMSGYLYIAVYLIGLTFLFLNRNHPGFIIIFIGVLLNFVVMAINGGRMPVSVEAAAILDPSYLDVTKNALYAKHAVMTESTKLGFLGDIIPLTNPYPRTQVISIGDIVMNIGAFIFIQHLMVGQLKETEKAKKPLVYKGGESS